MSRDILKTRLFATIEVQPREFVYAAGDLGLRLEVIYNKDPYTPFGVTLTPDEARWLADQLQWAAAKTDTPLGQESSS